MIEPQPMPYETVFSWVTRYHLRVSVGSEKNTYQVLFNKDKVRIHAYLPNALQHLDSRGKLSTKQWLNDHTLYPLFKFFGHDGKGKLLNAMFTDGGYAISHAHIPHSKLDFSYGHKICPECAQESRNKMGFAYYDIRCQIPGGEVCPDHGCYLHYTLCGDYALDRHLTLPRGLQSLSRCLPIEVQFARFCFEVLALSKTHYPKESLILIYRQVLAEKGFITRHQQIRMQLLVVTLTQFYRDFPFEKGWEMARDFHFLGALLRDKSQTLCHPAKHLLFAFWLFEGDASRYRLSLASQVAEPSTLSTNDVDEQKVMDLLKQGLSMEQVSLQTGQSRCYIRRRCELAGMSHQTNDNAYTPGIKHGVIVQAQLGRHRQAIADNFGVGIGYVEQVIANTKGLALWRKKLGMLKRISVSAQELLKARATHPNWLRKDYKSSHNKAFFYLYRFARELLESILPPKLKPRPPKHDWTAEDQRLFEAISHLQQASELSLTAIAQAIHDKGHLARKLDALPKTKALLIELGKWLSLPNKHRQRCFSVRRNLWAVATKYSAFF